MVSLGIEFLKNKKFISYLTKNPLQRIVKMGSITKSNKRFRQV